MRSIRAGRGYGIWTNLKEINFSIKHENEKKSTFNQIILS